VQTNVKDIMDSYPMPPIEKGLSENARKACQSRWENNVHKENGHRLGYCKYTTIGKPTNHSILVAAKDSLVQTPEIPL